jgi:uncharacterized repeat protein (TIGR01451 family)
MSRIPIIPRVIHLGLAALGGLLLMATVFLMLHGSLPVALADPIDPPAGYPKLTLSTKTVTPTLAHTGGATLHYVINIRNTGAYTAADVILTELLPDETTYNDDLQSDVPFALTVDGQTLTWVGDVGFDSTTVVSFSASVSPGFTGTVRNTAVISHPLITQPITLTAETVVIDEPLLSIEKTSAPAKPGSDKSLFYTLIVTNLGQPAVNLPITVADRVPLSTTLHSIGIDGYTTPISDVVTWTRDVTLEPGQTTAFTFSVKIGDVPSGTIIANQDYQVESSASGVMAGEPYTTAVVDPILSIAKHVWPDPPGSNREMTYTLTLLNSGSLATNLVVTDRVPTGVEYRRGGAESGGVVSWTLPSLDTGESVELTYTVYISDVMQVPIANAEYGVCSTGEGVCTSGEVLTNVVQGPTFETRVILDPIAKKPGGGGGPVTPTLVVRNLGPGNAINAMAYLEFRHISVSGNDLYAIPAIGTPPPFPDIDCGDKCVAYVWEGDLAYGEAVTFTTIVGQSTKVGEEGTIYTATVVITDSLTNMDTPPITGTANGKITHYANLISTKSAPPVIGRGQVLTYTIEVWNSALSTELPPTLTDTVPVSTTFIWASDGGITQTVDEKTTISWTLPSLGPGDKAWRSFSVLVDSDLISGTQIVNSDYGTSGYGNILTGTVTSGPPVTTTVQEIGLSDSYKEVTPTTALPGPGNVLTYYVHVVNSSPVSLTDVTVYDLLPWKSGTYQRDAVASTGDVISDIVGIHWMGDVAAFSSEVITCSVLVDADFQGTITNTAIISHPTLLNPVEVHAVAYITEKPVLRISKSASPDPAEKGAPLLYTIRVDNLGQQATNLTITDTVPSNTDYLAGGNLVGNQVHWKIPVLKAGDSRTFAFQVTVESGREVVNDQYGVTCAEGVSAAGAPVVTRIAGGGGNVYLPLVLRN